MSVERAVLGLRPWVMMPPAGMVRSGGDWRDPSSKELLVAPFYESILSTEITREPSQGSVECLSVALQHRSMGVVGSANRRGYL